MFQTHPSFEAEIWNKPLSIKPSQYFELMRVYVFMCWCVKKYWSGTAFHIKSFKLDYE